jgi:DNA invertase Pin-like site-specific DNA recombinase
LTGESETDSRKNVHNNDKHVVYIYVRQSQTDDEKSTSIETQIAECKKKAYDDGADDVIVFEDKDESGFSTEREGYQELMKKMQNDPRPVYVHRINRFGRSPLDAVAEIAELHRECELTLKTCKYGHYDLADMDDILFLFLNLLFAGKTVMQRIEAAWEVIYQKFEEGRNWHTWFKNVPLGYKLNDDGWIEPSEHGKTVVRAIANELLHANTRTEVVDRIEGFIENASIDSSTAKNSKTNERIKDLTEEQIKHTFEHSGYEIENFDSQKLKRLLTNTVLIGEVRFPRDQPAENQKVLEDEDLQLLDEELFEQVNESIERTAQKYSTDTSKNVDMEYLADHGMILRSMDVVDNIKPVCPNCDRGMVKNGQDHQYPLEDGRIAHYWKCNACADNADNDQTTPQQKVPYNKEWEAIKNELNENYEDKEDIILLRLVD